MGIIRGAHKIIILAAVALAVLLSGCGGSNHASGFQSPYTNEMYPQGTVINGYTLPPEPDHEENDKTLLGIDVNRNGMRDDVERYIIIEENQQPNKMPKTWTSIMLQKEKAMQYFWKKKNPEELFRWDSCYFAIENYLEKKGINILLSPLDKEYLPKTAENLDMLFYNTRDRDPEYVQRAYNGHLITAKGLFSDCDDNLTAFGELP